MSNTTAAAILAEESINLEAAGSELFKTLCFNCNFRHNCSWKENRKMYCEHFQ
ncbi:hypothetical protein [Salegentibacter echinorum]|nr:hypothetical protein [Salegentibacter echinorum]